MSWFSGPSVSGYCNSCGGEVHDGGQSGYYCSNPSCRHGWGAAVELPKPNVDGRYSLSYEIRRRGPDKRSEGGGGLSGTMDEIKTWADINLGRDNYDTTVDRFSRGEGTEWIEIPRENWPDFLKVLPNWPEETPMPEEPVPLFPYEIDTDQVRRGDLLWERPEWSLTRIEYVDRNHYSGVQIGYDGNMVRTLMGDTVTVYRPANSS
jgi:hypothetical protein